ncbi:unnamed protein product [Polarella glacialis]|uniref:Uncharacterized protein n=1 Tax=Polarella glacialis TaxID=89957 RepID=A0A813L7K4_POLGL|nr:unnamed protein product [Polarella glacialis]
MFCPTLNGGSSSSTALPTRKVALRGHFLSDDFNDGLDIDPVGTPYILEYRARLPLYKHKATGIMVWRRAIELATEYGGDSGNSKDCKLLFHYTTKGPFQGIASSAFVTHEHWAALKGPDGLVLASGKEPDQLPPSWHNPQERLGSLGSISSTLGINSHQLATPQSVTSHGLPHEFTKFCIPLLVPKDMAVRRSAAHESQSPRVPSASGKGDEEWVILCEDEAESLRMAASNSENRLRRIVETRLQAFGAEHPETLAGTDELAALLVAQGKLAAAEPLYQRSLHTLRTACNLATLLSASGKLSEAEALYRSACKGLEANLGPDHFDTVVSIGKFANLLQARSKLTERDVVYLFVVSFFLFLFTYWCCC